MRYLVCSFLLLFTLISPGFAQSDLIINADQINYDRENNVIEAQGNVVATAEELEVTAPYLIYHTDSQTIFTPDTFNMQRASVDLQGKTLSYGIISQEGYANAVNINYEGILLNGEKVQVTKDRYDLNNASFTSCNLSHPHYHISAADIQVYPESGWLVSYLGYLWLDGIPLVPVPAYLYDFQADEKGQHNAPPFPEIGSDQDNGSFAVERFPWNLSHDWNGYLSLSYAAKKGWGSGFFGKYNINIYNSGNIRLFGNPVDQWYGGLTHTYSFGNDLLPTLRNKLGWQPYVFGRNFELETLLSYHEKINYETVSFLPKVTFRARQLNVFSPQLKLDFSAANGFVSEESSGYGLNRSELASSLNYTIDLGNGNSITPGIDTDYVWYSNSTKWLRAIQDLKYNFTNEKLDFGVEHLHYFFNEGASPFNFENYKFVPLDEIDLSFSTKFWNSKIGINTYHYLPTFAPKDIDYSFYTGIHCYAIMFTYRAMRQEFLFGLDIIIPEKK